MSVIPISRGSFSGGQMPAGRLARAAECGVSREARNDLASRVRAALALHQAAAHPRLDVEAHRGRVPGVAGVSAEGLVLPLPF